MPIHAFATQQKQRKCAKTLLTGVVFSLTVLVAACAGTGPLTTPSSTGGQGSGGLLINVINNVTPVPTFLPITIGAWVSNQTPNQGDNITVYASVRTHNLATPGPPMPPNPPVSVTLSGPGINLPPATTGATDGIAVFHIQANGTPGNPVELFTSAVVNGQILRTETFYAVLPNVAPSPTITVTATP